MSPRGLALALAALVAVAFLTLPSTAAAHAFLVRSDPADGSRFESAPRQIRLSFSEDVSQGLSRVKLTGARTGTVPGATVTGRGKDLLVSLPRLARDTYSLYWLTVSADDLHITRGEVVFAYGTVAPLPPKTKAAPAPATPDSGEVVLRWLDFAAIAGLIGALALLAVCIPQAARRGASGLDAARRRLAGLAAAFGAAALATGFGLLLVQATGLSTESLPSGLSTIVLQTSYGPSWICREVLIGALLASALILGRRRRPGVLLVGHTVLASVALCISLAYNSHSAAARGHVSLATLALAFHLLTAAVWAGGVCALALVLIGKWRADNSASARLLLRTFGGLAVFCVAAVAITGLYSAGVSVASPDALVTTLYGRALLAKTTLFLIVGLIGLMNSLLVRTGGDGGRWLRRGIRIEAGLVAGVLLLAALLTATAPARGPEFSREAAQQPPAPQVVRSVQAGDLLLSLTVKPNQPGVNFVTAGVFDTTRPAPAPIRAVELAVGGSWQKATRLRDQYWQATGGQLNRPGRWPIGVRIHRPGLPDQTANIPWTLPRLRPAPPGRRVLPSSQSLGPILSNVSAAGALVLAVGLLTLLLGRRRSGRTFAGAPPTVDGVR